MAVERRGYGVAICTTCMYRYEVHTSDSPGRREVRTLCDKVRAGHADDPDPPLAVKADAELCSRAQAPLAALPADQHPVQIVHCPYDLRISTCDVATSTGSARM